jgi:Spy/CpxP family protein refolding chaperone
LIKSQLEQQIEGKISRMKARLRLTSEQEQAIRESMNAATKKMLAATQKMYSGEAKSDDIANIASSDATGMQPIEDLLTPEQRTEYDALQKEEFQNTARVAASAEMIQLQSSLGLTQEQQDKVFSALYQQSVDPVSGLEATQKSASINDPAAALQQVFDKKVEALKPILTSEQLKTYRDLQEKQIQMIQAFFPKGAAPVPPTPTTLQSP